MSDVKITTEGVTVQGAKLNLEGDVVLEGYIGKLIEYRLTGLRSDISTLEGEVSYLRSEINKLEKENE